MTMTTKCGSRPATVLSVVAASLFAVGCAGPAAPPPSPAPAVSAQPAPRAATAVPIAGAVSVAQLPVLLDALQMDLLQRLKPDSSSGAVAVSRLSDGAPRVTLDATRAFEAGSAQMRPETLLRLAESAAAAQVSGSFIIHVIGYGEAVSGSPDVETLAERRATAAAVYLQSRGLPISRVRSEGRATRDRESTRRLDIVFEPIVEGREVRAWIPPVVAVSK